MDLHYTRRGQGAPLLLLHGLGGSGVVWRPVLDLLASERDTIALDLPGFGRSLAPGDGFVPSAAALAERVSAFCAALGVERPHVAGNSLGGWVALELAAQGAAASVCAISPAGMWRAPLGPRRLERQSLGRALRPLIGPLVAVPQARRLILASTMAHPERVPRADAAELVAGYLDAPLFAAANQAMRAGVFERAGGVDVPVTIAWGKRDRIVGRPSRTRRPQGARYVEMEGWGHTPTWDDPVGVAALIIEASGG